jgi:archaellin
MNGPISEIASWTRELLISFLFRTNDGTEILYKKPTQIRIYGAPPNNTLITLTSYSNVWLDDVQWTVKQILWQGNNVVPDPNPSYLPTPDGIWTINCRVYKITALIFNDHSGNLLYMPPTRAIFTAPNNTDISLNSFTGLALYLQNGTYTFKNITWQSNNVVDSPPQTFDPTNGNPSINCRVYSLRITVKDSSSVPLASASITILSPNGTSLFKYSDSDGVYQASQIQNGTFIVTVTWQDVTVNSSAINIESDIDQTLTCQVYMITVYVYDENNQTVPGASLTLYRNDANLNGVYGLPSAPSTNSNGYYTWYQMAIQTHSYNVKALYIGTDGIRRAGWSGEKLLVSDITKANAWKIKVVPVINVYVQTADWDGEAYPCEDRWAGIELHRRKWMDKLH